VHRDRIRAGRNGEGPDDLAEREVRQQAGAPEGHVHRQACRRTGDVGGRDAVNHEYLGVVLRGRGRGDEQQGSEEQTPFHDALRQRK